MSDFFIMVAKVKLTDEQIRQKWDYQLRVLEIKKKKEVHDRIEAYRTKLHEEKTLELERKTDQLRKKMRAFLKKKMLEYDRKCKNEIRKNQGKEEKKYKEKPISRNKKLQLTLKLAQENARLRDTDENGNWYCISCNERCSWEGLAGGHEFSRTIQGVCLRESNINAQCHNCNDIMGPRGNPLQKKKTEMAYEENNRKKRGDAEIDMLIENAKKSIMNPNKYAPSLEYISDIFPELVRKNEELWKTKSQEFRDSHKPFKNRRKVYEKYFTPKERWLWD